MQTDKLTLIIIYVILINYEARCGLYLGIYSILFYLVKLIHERK